MIKYDIINNQYITSKDDVIEHAGVKGMKWGIRKIRDKVRGLRDRFRERKYGLEKGQKFGKEDRLMIDAFSKGSPKAVKQIRAKALTLKGKDLDRFINKLERSQKVDYILKNIRRKENGITRFGKSVAGDITKDVIKNTVTRGISNFVSKKIGIENPHYGGKKHKYKKKHYHNN